MRTTSLVSPLVITLAVGGCVADEPVDPPTEPIAATAPPQLLTLDGAPAAAVLALSPADPCGATTWTVRLGADLAGPACAWLDRALDGPLVGGNASIYLRNPARRLDLSGLYVEAVTLPLADRAQATTTGFDVRLRATTSACKPVSAATLTAADAEALARAKRSSRADRFIARLGDAPTPPQRLDGKTTATENASFGEFTVAYNTAETAAVLAWIDALLKKEEVVAFGSTLAYTLPDGVSLVELAFTTDQLEYYGAQLRARARSWALRCKPR